MIFTVILATGPGFTAEDAGDCLWGGAKERTTYQRPYCPGMAPHVPVLEQSAKTPADLERLAVSPETALTVRGSDGQCYSFYFREETQMQLRTNLPPDQQFQIEQREQYNPCTGQLELMPVRVPTPGEYWYEPVRVRIKVVTPCPPPCEDMNARFGKPEEPPGAASVGFSSKPEK
ncbi:MAG: hypothetical protein Q4G68_05690 [Planctomycetia bacterium]|nr:hypothetical protein [Planctomycetia bacterium]